jgi:phosphodiesterase/alkaline phosphatase D-like protein
LNYKSGTAKNDTATAVAIVPGAGTTANGVTPFIFQGPWTIAASKSLVIDYKMNAAKCAATGTTTYNNVATAQIGSTVIGTSGTSQVQVASSQTCASVGGSPTLQQSTTTVTIDPVVTTGAASNVSTNSTSSTSSATVGGVVDRNGSTPSSYSCEYSTDSGLAGSSSATATTSGSSDPISASCSLTNLTPGTTYYYRLKYNGTYTGEILSFTTPPVVGAAPVPTTTAATNISYTGGSDGAATINGTINPNAYTVTPSFNLAASTSNSACTTMGTVTNHPVTELDENGNAVAVSLTGIFAAPVSFDKTGLSSGWYCYQVKGVYLNSSNVSTTVTGAWLAVQIIATGAPTATTVAASNVNSTSARINGSVAAGNQTTTVTFCWGTASDLTGCATVTAPESTIDGTSPIDVTYDLTGLSPSTTYYFRVIGANATSTVQGSILNFTTPVAAQAPGVTTQPASLVTGNTATLHGDVIANNANTTIYFCLSTSNAVTGSQMNACSNTALRKTPSTNTSATGSSSVSSTYNATGLSANTVYYYQIIGVNSVGTQYGLLETFTTAAASATGDTNAASSVAERTATLNGVATAGSFGVTLKFCYALANVTITGGVMQTCLNSGPNTADSTSTLNAGNSGNPALDISGLTPGTTYKFQLQIVPTSGSTVYGQVLSFTTLFNNATATTNAASSVSKTTATVNGSSVAGSYNGTVKFCVDISGVTSNGNLVSCSVTTTNPLASPSANASTNHSENLTGLSGGTTYYFQVIFDPSSGDNVYGSVLNFTTTDDPTATTQAASSIADTTATVNGSVNAKGLLTTATFCISLSSAVTSGSLSNCLPSGPVTPTPGTASGNSGTATSYAASGLTPSTTYYFQVIGQNSNGTAKGSVLSFTTLATASPSPSPSATQNNNGNGGGNGNSAPTPSPTPSVVATASPTPTPSSTPRATNRPNPRPNASTPAPNTSPAPRVTPNPAAQPTPTPSAVPTAQPTINKLLAEAKKVEAVAPDNSTSAAPKTNNAPSPTPANTDGTIARPARAEEKVAVVSTNSNGSTNTLATATKPIAEVAQEKIAGFAPAVGLRIEVIGSRIAGQFVLAPGDAGDPIAVAAAIEESTSRNRTAFASIEEVVRTLPPLADEVYSTKIQAAQIDLFAASGLAKPQSLGSLNFGSKTKWISVYAKASTYVPGSIVYLTVTSQPIIFAEAVVDKFGKANITGKLPIDLLETGGHSLRLVGIRSFEGVSTDANGEIQLNDYAVNEIQKFDDGTQATVILSGTSADGGVHSAIREIPLDRDVPWWTVWFAFISGIILLVIRLWKPPVGPRRRITTVVLAVAAGVPAAVLGWIQIAYEVWIGVAIALAFAAFNLLWMRGKSKAQKQQPARRRK